MPDMGRNFSADSGRGPENSGGLLVRLLVTASVVRPAVAR
jgi:hypothetical protein